MPGHPVLDPAPLERLRRLGGDPLARKMLDLFREAAPPRLAAARDAAGAGDLAAVARAAHALISNAGNVGGSELTEAARALEAAASAGDAAAVPALLTRLDAAFERLAGALAATSGDAA